MSSRRHFIQMSSALATGLMLAPGFAFSRLTAPKGQSTISLAEWSLHKALFSKKITNLDFPAVAKKTYDISVVEYVNQFFKDKAEDTIYLNQLLQRCKDNGVTNHLIMIDGEGGLGDIDNSKRQKAIENHYKWVNAAKYLGCTTIRVNAYGEGSADEVQKSAVDGLSKLGEYAAKEGINVIVENHGGHSSNGQWLAAVMKQVDRTNVGTLPDFGNFCLERGQNYTCLKEYDRYQGTRELMPFAKGVSAKTYDFDAQGNCIETDYKRILGIVKDAGFNGYIGIEYEGDKLSEEEGIKKTKALLKRVAQEVNYAIA
jgi:sugar phosphate isomerase/epimerase